MFFGEYLVRNQVITSDQLVEALAIQLERLPSILRLLKEENLLSSDKLIEVLNTQIDTRSNILSVIRSKGLLDDQQIEKILTKQVEKRIPLGELLADLKIVQIKIVEKYLFEYLDAKVPEAPEVQEVQGESSVSQVDELPGGAAHGEVVADLVTSDTKNDSTGVDFSLLEKEFDFSRENQFIYLSELTTVLDEKKYERLNKLMAFIEKSFKEGGSLTNYINSLYTDIQSIKGVFYLVDVEVGKKLIDQLEEMIEQHLQEKDEELMGWIENNLEVLKQTIVFLWDVRNNVAENNPESQLWNDKSWREGYLGNYYQLKKIA